MGGGGDRMKVDDVAEGSVFATNCSGCIDTAGIRKEDIYTRCMCAIVLVNVVGKYEWVTSICF